MAAHYTVSTDCCVLDCGDYVPVHNFLVRALWLFSFVVFLGMGICARLQYDWVYPGL